MDHILFQAEVTGVGKLALGMFSDGMMIFFDKRVKENVPDLIDYSVLLDIRINEGSIAPGQRLQIGNAEFDILAVGDVVNQNVQNLGHSVLVFDGSYEATLPGNIHLNRAEIPLIQLGTTITICVK